MASITAHTSPLTRDQVAHLLRRATFGPTKADIDQYTGMTASQILEVLIPEEIPDLEAPNEPITGLPITSNFEDTPDGVDLGTVFRGWWMEQMRTEGLSIVERIVYFYHTHFTTISSVVRSTRGLYYQNALFRHYALGDFKELSLKLCTDNAMLRFLDGTENVVGLPQENFAREFLELYTIGKGPQIGPGDYTHFTETDVQEGARVLSGYGFDKDFVNLDPDTLIPAGTLKGNGTVAQQHDPDPKTFSEKFGNQTIEPLEVVNGRATKEAAQQELVDFVDMIFAQDETALHICRKLYRYFVYYNITDEIEQDIITPLADTFRTNDYNIIPVIEQLLQSEHFYDLDDTLDENDVNGAIIKSPLDLTLGVFRFFEVEFPDAATDATTLYYTTYAAILEYLEDQGLNLYEPFEVAGYPAYHQNPDFNRNWISANYLGRRYQFIDLMLNGATKGGDPTGILLDPMAFVEDNTNITFPQDSDEIVSVFVDYLLPEIITEERYNYLKDFVLLDDLSPINWANEWNAYESSGDDSAVRSQLNNFCNAIMQAPEFQLY